MQIFLERGLEPKVQLNIAYQGPSFIAPHRHGGRTELMNVQPMVGIRTSEHGIQRGGVFLDITSLDDASPKRFIEDGARKGPVSLIRGYRTARIIGDLQLVEPDILTQAYLAAEPVQKPGQESSSNFLAAISGRRNAFNDFLDNLLSSKLPWGDLRKIITGVMEDEALLLYHDKDELEPHLQSAHAIDRDLVHSFYARRQEAEERAAHSKVSAAAQLNHPGEAKSIFMVSGVRGWFKRD